MTKPSMNIIRLWYDRAAAKRAFDAMMQMKKSLKLLMATITTRQTVF